MAKVEDVAQRVMERFSELRLHDSRVIGMSVSRMEGENTDRLTLDLSLLSGDHADEWLPGQLIFLDCGGVELNMDFWAKRVCADAIIDTSCAYDPDFAAKNLDDNPIRDSIQPVRGLLVFTVRLCPPSGEIRVFASDFRLKRATDRG